MCSAMGSHGGLRIPYQVQATLDCALHKASCYPRVWTEGQDPADELGLILGGSGRCPQRGHGSGN